MTLTDERRKALMKYLGDGVDYNYRLSPEEMQKVVDSQDEKARMVTRWEKR